MHSYDDGGTVVSIIPSGLRFNNADGPAPYGSLPTTSSDKYNRSRYKYITRTKRSEEIPRTIVGTSHAQNGQSRNKPHFCTKIRYKTRVMRTIVRGFYFDLTFAN